MYIGYTCWVLYLHIYWVLYYIYIGYFTTYMLGIYVGYYDYVHWVYTLGNINIYWVYVLRNLHIYWVHTLGTLTMYIGYIRWVSCHPTHMPVPNIYVHIHWVICGGLHSHMLSTHPYICWVTQYIGWVTFVLPNIYGFYVAQYIYVTHYIYTQYIYCVTQHICALQNRLIWVNPDICWITYHIHL